MEKMDRKFNSWLDRFFTSYYKNRPVNATFIGVHDYDNLLPDFSPEGVAKTIEEMEGLRDDLGQLSVNSLSKWEKLDLQAAGGFLDTQLWEYRSNHFQNGNPSVYTGEAVFGVMSLFFNTATPAVDRISAAQKRMQAIAPFLEQGRRNISEAPSGWTHRAINECDGAIAFFTNGINQLIVDYGIHDPEFRLAADLAETAFREFKGYLENEVLPCANQNYGAGKDALDLMIRKAHFIDMTTDEIVQYAEMQWNDADTYLQEHAGDFGSNDPKQVLAGLLNEHPSLDNYYATFKQVWNACKETVIENNLVTWPDFPIEYGPRPVWSREAAPYLYFLFYRAPSTFNRQAVHQYMLAPLDPELSPEQAEKFLQANNNSVIKLNHVVHHGSIGHHVQNWNAIHSKSRIGQMAAVDCASRTAMLSAGTMAEGWACYATDLMSEVGFLTPLEMYSEYQGRKRMCARAIVDVKLHTKEFSLEDAAAFYQARAGMSLTAAKNEAVKNSMFPGGALMYLLGNDMIHDLRAEMKDKSGPGFNLKNFHDQFLSYGSLPVALISKEIRRQEL